jgi:hypothetical protein
VRSAQRLVAGDASRRVPTYDVRMANTREFRERERDHAIGSLVATVFLTGIMRSAQEFGITRIDLPLMLGTVLTPDRDRAKVYGTIVQMINGWLFGTIYVAAFHSWGRAGALRGALVGLVHGVFVLIAVLPLLPGAHRRMASSFTGPQPTTRLEPPGFIGLNYGRGTPMLTVIAHVVYGAVLGSFYRVGRRRE